MTKIYFVFLIAILLIQSTLALPEGFVYLSDIDPTIKQDIRYFKEYNFVGRPLQGYKKGVCILTRKAAEALRDVQQSLQTLSGGKFSLKVYDCYRPTKTVSDILSWAADRSDEGVMKEEFFPDLSKQDITRLGYVATKSGHSRGSTVDLTIINTELPDPQFNPRYPLIPCDDEERRQDNSINMGTNFDCFSYLSHTFSAAADLMFKGAIMDNRRLLVSQMKNAGFNNFEKEWWHYTLQDEPFPSTYFDFDIE